MVISPVSQNFPVETALIGQLVIGYSDLELILMYCVKGVMENFDDGFKAIYGKRNFTTRITQATHICQLTYDKMGLGAEFILACDAIRYCLKIRSQYAHRQWWDDNTGVLTFGNLEDVAKKVKNVSDLSDVESKHVNVELLRAQVTYFNYACTLITWVMQAPLIRNGVSVHPKVDYPETLPKPPLST